MKLNKKINKPLFMTAKSIAFDRALAINKIAELESTLKIADLEQEYLLKQISSIVGKEVDEDFLYGGEYESFKTTIKGWELIKVMRLGAKYAILDGMKTNWRCAAAGWKGVERSLSEI